MPLFLEYRDLSVSFLSDISSLVEHVKQAVAGCSGQSLGLDAQRSQSSCTGGVLSRVGLCSGERFMPKCILEAL